MVDRLTKIVNNRASMTELRTKKHKKLCVSMSLNNSRRMIEKDPVYERTGDPHLRDNTNEDGNNEMNQGSPVPELEDGVNTTRRTINKSSSLQYNNFASPNVQS